MIRKQPLRRNIRGRSAVSCAVLPPPRSPRWLRAASGHLPVVPPARLAAPASRFPFLTGLLLVEPLLFPLQLALLPDRLALLTPVALVCALLLVETLPFLPVPPPLLLELSLRAVAEFLLAT